jgi:excisionase family DNA binding protein
MSSIQIIDVPAQAAFKVSQAARYLGISPNTLRKKADLGLIPAHKTEVGERIFLLRDLDAYLICLPSYRSGANSFPSRLTKTGRMSKGDAK